MTNKDAKIVINLLLEDNKNENVKQALEIVNDALDKQIPKKPVFVHPLQNDDCGDFMCIVCKTGSVLNAYGKKSNYCWNCGQAIDWSGEHDE